MSAVMLRQHGFRKRHKVTSQKRSGGMKKWNLLIRPSQAQMFLATKIPRVTEQHRPDVFGMRCDIFPGRDTQLNFSREAKQGLLPVKHCLGKCLSDCQRERLT